MIFCICRCVIGELFTDGRQLFDLSQLLELRSKQGEYSPEILLKKIADKPVRVSPLTNQLIRIYQPGTGHFGEVVLSFEVQNNLY